MTEKAILQWIKTNCSSYIEKAIAGTPFTTDILAGMTMRETGFLIARYIGQGKTPAEIFPLMKGDYSQRQGETEKQYHGWGLIQIDIGSYPDFVNSGDWKDPQRCYNKAVSVLQDKAKELSKYYISSIEAIVAAYNTGSYNARKGLMKANDPDLYTHQHNYGKEVKRFASIYKALP